ncbi:MAG: YdeI/OmpD-associated family protein [Anaerolineales bacterium]
MKLGKTLEVSSRAAWRRWLAANHKKADEIWLVFYRKSSGKPRISYNDAVEEALCYGWIDSILKPIDKERFAQRFSSRRPKSNLSEMNKQRIRKLIANKKMTKAGLAAVEGLYKPAKEKKLRAPSYLLKALKAEPGIWRNFEKFPESYKRIRVAYIESQKRHGKEQHQRALNHFVRMTAKNKRIGFVKEFK